eukprot:5988183-Pleurochrysis_carterae.AAC.1
MRSVKRCVVKRRAAHDGGLQPQAVRGIIGRRMHTPGRPARTRSGAWGGKRTARTPTRHKGTRAPRAPRAAHAQCARAAPATSTA